MNWLLLITASALAGDVSPIEDFSEEALLLEVTVLSTSCDRFLIDESSTRVAYYSSEVSVDAFINIPEEYDELRVGDRLTVTWGHTDYGIAGPPESCGDISLHLPAGWSGPMHLYSIGDDVPLMVSPLLQESHEVPMPEDGYVPACGEDEQADFIDDMHGSAEDQTRFQSQDSTDRSSCSVTSGTPGLFLLISGVLGVFRRRR